MMPEFMMSPSTGRYYYEDEQGEFTEVPSHVVETTPGQRMLIGAGRQFTRLGRGIADLFAPSRERAQLQAEENAAYNPLSEAFPYSTGFGEALPGISTIPLGLGIGGAALGKGGQLALSTALPGIEGALAFSPDEGQQLQQGIIGAGFGAAGHGLGVIAERVLRGIGKAATTPTLTDEARRLTELGGEGLVTQGQASGSPALRQYEESLLSNPIARARLGEPAARRQAITNQRAAQAIGVPEAERLTPEVLAEAENRLGQFYQQFATGRAPIELNETLVKRLMSRNEIKDIVGLGGLEGLEDGLIRSGQDILDVRSTLTGLISEATGKKSGQFTSLQNLLEQFDDQVAFEFGPDAVRELNRANEQFRNLALMQRQGVVKDGDVSANILRNRLQQNYGKTFTQDRRGNIQPETAELFDWARAETAPGVRPIVGDSGTATRLGTQQLTADLAEGLANRDPGALARVLGTMSAGGIYSRLATSSPGFFTGLLAPPGSVGARVGGQLFDENALDAFRRE
jgi:hypothetical protein